MKNITLVLCLLFANQAWSFTKLDLCEIHGFFQGNNEDFLSDLASSYLYEDGFIVNSQCDTLRLAGFNVAKKGQQANRGAWSSNELETIKKMNQFKRQIIGSILQNSNIKVEQ